MRKWLHSIVIIGGWLVFAGCGDDAPVVTDACANKVLDALEADIDCGGPKCKPCGVGQSCKTAADCTTGACIGGKCAMGGCTNGQKDGAETDVDCGGGTCPGCGEGKACGKTEDCGAGMCVGGKCSVPSCADKVKNQDETDIDCGGACMAKCADGLVCGKDADCMTANCLGGKCTAPSCSDGKKNGTELDIDCGGGACPACADGKACLGPTDCVSAVCSGGSCATASCNDTTRNGAETDVDCGGTCPVCADGKTCALAADCSSGVCTGGKCQAAACTDMVKNGDESDKDCGGKCPACLDGKECKKADDCSSKNCVGGQCVSAGCTDKIKNGDETDVDCGGKCAPCKAGLVCAKNEDCESVICTGGKCAEATCMDKVTNQDESDVDCGGKCPGCADGKTCKDGKDCASLVCKGGKCAAPVCDDGAKNADETDVDCGGGKCSACAAGKACAKVTDCVSMICMGGKCVCAMGLTDCTGACVDTSKDIKNCGACATACKGTEQCISGKCVDIAFEVAIADCRVLDIKNIGGVALKAFTVKVDGTTVGVAQPASIDVGKNDKLYINYVIANGQKVEVSTGGVSVTKAQANNCAIRVGFADYGDYGGDNAAITRSITDVGADFKARTGLAVETERGPNDYCWGGFKEQRFTKVAEYSQLEKLDFLYYHSHSGFNPTLAEERNLYTWVTRGGLLLFDDCGGATSVILNESNDPAGAFNINIGLAGSTGGTGAATVKLKDTDLLDGPYKFTAEQFGRVPGWTEGGQQNIAPSGVVAIIQRGSSPLVSGKQVGLGWVAFMGGDWGCNLNCGCSAGETAAHQQYMNFAWISSGRGKLIK